MLYTPGLVLWQRGDVGRIESLGAVWMRAHAQLTTIATASVCNTPRAATACPALTAAVMQWIAPQFRDSCANSGGGAGAVPESSRWPSSAGWPSV